MSPCWTTDPRPNVSVDVQGNHTSPNESDATWTNLEALDTAMDLLSCLLHKPFRQAMRWLSRARPRLMCWFPVTQAGLVKERRDGGFWISATRAIPYS